MTTEAAVKIVEDFTPEETKMVRDAYRNFLANFDCGKCPTIRQTTPFVEPEMLLGFVIDKQGGEEPCNLCHGFPALLPGFDTGCPCLVMSKDVAYKRLVELVESWNE